MPHTSKSAMASSSVTLDKHEQARRSELSGLPPFKPHGCEHCSRLVVKFPRTSARNRSPDWIYKDFPLEGLSEDVFRDAAASECPLFSRAHPEDHAHLFDWHGEPTSRQLGDAKGFVLRVVRSVGARGEDGGSGNLYSARIAPSHYEDVTGRKSVFVDHDLLTDNDLDVPRWLSIRWTGYTSPATEESFTQVRAWLDECCESTTHEHCRLTPGDFVPSRLVRIPAAGASTSVTIVETKGSYVPWCALSYCWGGPQLMRTTSANFSNGFRIIELSVLPKTILDAIVVARKLGLSHLWVDSMCIIQDDPQDLLKELASMPSIYRDSLLTIVAANAAACTDGFLHPRVPREHGVPVSLQCRDDGGTRGSVVLHGTFKPEEPVHERAWTMQEQLLSPRTLQYNTSTLVWSCKSRKYTDAPDSAIIYEPDAYRFFSYFASRFDAGELSGDDAVVLWLSVVEHYSTRRLGFESDRLIALSAIAEEFGAKAGWRYAAGLWEERIRAMLGWRCETSAGHRRPEQYRAPSWSWSSIDGLNGVRVLDVNTFHAFEAQVHVAVEPVEPELPCGNVRSGSLSTKCLAVGARLHRHLGVPYISVGGEVFGKVQHELSANYSGGKVVCLDAPADDFSRWEDNIGWDVCLLPFRPFSEISPSMSLIVQNLPGDACRIQRVGLLYLVLHDEIDNFNGVLHGQKQRDLIIV